MRRYRSPQSPKTQACWRQVALRARKLNDEKYVYDSIQFIEGSGCSMFGSFFGLRRTGESTATYRYSGTRQVAHMRRGHWVGPT